MTWVLLLKLLWCASVPLAFILGVILAGGGR